MAPGDYTATVTLTPASGPALTLPASFVVNPAPATPSASAIVNAASYQAVVAPGGLFSVFAGNLSTDTLLGPAAPWPASWNGIAVKLNGIAAPLEYVGPNQVNAQAPFQLPPGPAQLTIESNGVATSPVTVTIQATAPGVFLGPGGHAIAWNQDFSVNSPSNPAATGSYLSVYVTGQGAVDQPVANGATAPTDHVVNTVAATTATVGGIPADISFSGLAPGFAGVGQINLKIPDLPSGDYPLVITIGGVASNTALVSVLR
jgi:uncharacterized protein (TIGR03437 family)